MNIIKTSRTLNKIELYLTTQAQDIISMKDVEDGTSIPVDYWTVFEDENAKGEINEILAIRSKDGNTYALQSATFKRNMMNVAELMGEESYSIIKMSGVTNNGRDFINCALDVTSVNV